MKDKTKLKSNLLDASKLIDKSEDAKSFFIHLKAYLDFLHQDRELIDFIDLEARNEKSRLHKNDIEKRKHTSFWYPWEELDAFWELDNFGHQELSKLYKQNSTIRRDEHGHEYEVIDLTSNAGMLLADNDLGDIYSGNPDTQYLGFNVQDYRLYFDSVHLRITQWLSNDATDKEHIAGTAHVVMSGNVVKIELPNGDYVPIKSLSSDEAPYNFMQYILNHPNTSIPLTKVQEIEGCKTKDDLTELARNCGFNKELKRVFFTKCSAKKIHFIGSVQVSAEQSRTIDKMQTVRNRILNT